MPDVIQLGFEINPVNAVMVPIQKTDLSTLITSCLAIRDAAVQTVDLLGRDMCPALARAVEELNAKLTKPSNLAVHDPMFLLDTGAGLALRMMNGQWIAVFHATDVGPACIMLIGEDRQPIRAWHFHDWVEAYVAAMDWNIEISIYPPRYRAVVEHPAFPPRGKRRFLETQR